VTLPSPARPERGWYDDPHAADVLRWWDGAAWGPQTCPRPAAAPRPASPAPRRTASRGSAGRGGSFLVAVAVLVKAGAVLLKLKFLVSAGTALISVAAYAWVFGVPFAVGLVALLLVHELGHVAALRLRGIPAGLPVFLPFLGAFVRLERAPRSVYVEAESALAGPLVGGLGALVLAYAAQTGGQGLEGHPLLRSLAYTGFLLNAVNLLPALPLDGGRAAGALHPGVWLAGIAIAVGVEIWRPSLVLLLIIVLGAREAWHRWRRRDADADYLTLTAGQRTRIATAYVLLLATLALGAALTYAPRSFT